MDANVKMVLCPRMVRIYKPLGRRQVRIAILAGLLALSALAAMAAANVLDAPVAGGDPHALVKTTFAAAPNMAGQLVYWANTAVYGHGGFAWPWSLYLTTWSVSPTHDDVVPPPATVASRQLHTADDAQFAFEPHIAPDGEHVAFKVGVPYSSWTTFTVHIADLRTGALESVDAKMPGAYYWPLLWSPNSRFLACICGGIDYPRGPAMPQSLWVYDRQTHRSTQVVKLEGLVGNVSWTADNQLLYSRVPETEPKKTLTGLYAHDPANHGPARLLVPDALLASASPDGKYIVAYSLLNERYTLPDARREPIPANPDLNTFTPDGKMVLDGAKSSTRKAMIFPREGGHPIPVDMPEDAVGRRTVFSWSPDSKRFYWSTGLRKAGENVSRRFFETVVEGHATTCLATMVYLDRNSSDESDILPLFVAGGVSPDGRYLQFRLTRGTYDSPDRKRGDPLTTQQVLDLKTHEIHVIFAGLVAGGSDWRDLPKLPGSAPPRE